MGILVSFMPENKPTPPPLPKAKATAKKSKTQKTK